MRTIFVSPHPGNTLQITIRLFASMAQHAGRDRAAVEIPSDSRLSDAVEALHRTLPTLSWPAGVMIAVNQEYASLDRLLVEGDEVAIIPPVSGGCG